MTTDDTPTAGPFSRDQVDLNKSALDDERLLSGPCWNELRVFLAVAKTGSFSRAAESINISQPTVGRQVRRLQDLMQAQLCISTSQGVKLTDKGTALAKVLSHLDQTLFSLANDLRGETRQAEGVVRISITDGLNTFFVAPAVGRFSREYPKIQVHLKSPLNMLSLRENQTDLMVGFVGHEAADVTVRKLGFLHFLPIATKSYIQQFGLPTKKNLRDHLFLQSEMYAANTGLWDGWQKAVAEGKIAHHCDNSFAYGMLVKAGLGIGLLGNYAVLEPAAVPLEIVPPISVPLYAIAMTDRLQSKPVQLAFDWLCWLFGEANPWFRKEFRIDNAPSEFDDGFKMLFNL